MITRRVIYREPDGIEALIGSVPVWATPDAIKLQDRLLWFILMHQKATMYVPAPSFLSYTHRAILNGVQKCGGEFLDYLKRCRGATLDVLMRVSQHSDEYVSSEEIAVMRRQMAELFAYQQDAMHHLEQAALAWTGKKTQGGNTDVGIKSA
jgi:hypothetical protein